MSASKSPERRRRASRRAFLKTIAAGSAAALAAPALSLAADEKAAKAAAPEKTAGTKPGDAAAPRPPEIEKGIAEQKAYLKQSLEAIRGYELPTNSEQAFTFAPLESPRGGRKP